ncbi:hypothetical protein [Agromyces bauzanensis]
MSRTIWTVIGVIAAVLIAWFIVDVVFSVLWFIVKLAIVGVVAVVVFFVLRALVRPSDDRRSIER